MPLKQRCHNDLRIRPLLTTQIARKVDAQEAVSTRVTDQQSAEVCF